MAGERTMYVIKTAAALSIFLLSIIFSFSCSDTPETALKTPELLKEHCSKYIGKPRVEKISNHVWMATGYDLANTLLIHTKDGNIIIDPAMSPARAREIKKALLAEAPQAPILAIVYTHSHIDHIGGAVVWAEKGTPIWATKNFLPHLFKQYNLFSPIETIRGRRQFGDNVSLENLPCNGIGRRTDIRAALKNGVMLPTDTFTGEKKLTLGGLEVHLIEAHGETHDQLIVWIPADSTLIAGDNFYWTFPNLYTIRGTSPRPVGQWIKSIDQMRRLAPEHLAPCHTIPIHGRKKINAILTDYRDAIQWVHDETVRGANKGHDIDTLAETIKLPEHLKNKHYNTEFYGQVDWSVRAIYSNNLGWFDGRPEALYPPRAREAALREITMMGGPAKVMAAAKSAVNKKDYRWALHLLAKVKRSGHEGSELTDSLAGVMEKLGGSLYNLNGRGYLLESARELRKGAVKYPAPTYRKAMASRIPLDLIFSQMEVRLKTEKAMDVHESVHFIFPREKKKFIVTIRRGICEAVQGNPLPGTPKPTAVVTVDAQTWRYMALKITSPLKAVTSGRLKVTGSKTGFLSFMRRFEM